MITIDHLSADYRIAAQADARAQAARRLDHICRALLSEALEGAAQDFADANGPVIRIRRLKLKLWLDLARRSDGDIAQDWANLLAKALHRQIAEAGPDEVRRYDSQSSYLAAWIDDVLHGSAAGQWMYTEFAALDDLPRGQIIAAGLVRYPKHITAVLKALSRRGRLEPVIATMTVRDVTALWTAWVGERPLVAPDINLSLLRRVITDHMDVITTERGGANARARSALRWLVSLTMGQAGLRPEVAGPLALQVAHLSALVLAIPGFAQVWEKPSILASEIRQIFATAPHGLETSVNWAKLLCADASQHAARVALLTLVRPRISTIEDPRKVASAARKPERVATPFAGAALLLPAIRDVDPLNEWTAQDRMHLLAGLFSGAQGLMARGDVGLRWMTGVPLDLILEEPSDGWEERSSLALVRFRGGLRGMDTASATYLTKQFFEQSGSVELGKEELHVRINVIPLKVLLQLGGRIGQQGGVPWLDERLLRIEVGDG